MAERWRDKLVLKMRSNRIKQKDLANKLGKSDPYISHVMNGMQVSDEMQRAFKTAVDELIAEKKVKE